MNFPYILLAILFFSALIFIHELGHFIVAKLCGVKILEFAIGMGPKLISYRSKKSGTAYSIRLFPIGGFVSMLGETGMELAQGSADAKPEGEEPSKSKSFFVTDETPAEPKQVDPELAKHAYCNQSVWKRLLISLAGPLMNVLLGFVLMFVLVLAAGPRYFGSNQVAAFPLEYTAEESAQGFQKGDYIGTVALSGNSEKEAPKSMAEFRQLVAKNPNALFDVTVIRAVSGKGELVELKGISLSEAFLESRFHYPNSERSDLQVNDRIIRVGNTPVHTADEVSYEIFHRGDKPLTLTVLRNEEQVTLENVIFQTEAEKGVTFGIQDFQLYQEPSFDFPTILKHTFWRSCSTVKMVFDSLGGLFSGRYGVEAVSGPVGITEAITVAAKTNWLNVLNLLIMISINLGIMNLMPIPGLDGGHILIYLIEAVRRKPLKPEVEGIINFIGLALMLGLIILISIKDVIAL